MLQFAGQVHAAFGWIALAEPLSDRNPSPDLHYWVDSTAADLAMANGQIDESIRLAGKAAAAARASNNPRREAQSYLTLIPLHIAKGQTALALREAALVRKLAVHSTDPGLVVSGWSWKPSRPPPTTSRGCPCGRARWRSRRSTSWRRRCRPPRWR